MPASTLEVVGGAVDDVLEEPEVVSALDRLLLEVVLAAGIPGAGASTVDVAAVLQPAAPAIARSISQSSDGQVTTEQISRVIDGLEPLVVRASGSTPVVGSSSPIAGRLGTATLLAMLTMLLTGWLVVASSKDRLVAVKGLLTRVSLGALSFAVMLRIGSWVLNPSGGRAPVSQTMSALFQSKWMVPLLVAGVAGVGVLVAWVLKRRSKSGNPELSGAQPLELDAVAY